MPEEILAMMHSSVVSYPRTLARSSIRARHSLWLEFSVTVLPLLVLVTSSIQALGLAALDGLSRISSNQDSPV